MKRGIVLVVVAAALAGCGDDPVSFPPGAIVVSVVTTGIDRDGEFDVSVNGQTRQTGGSPPRAPIVDLPVGSYSVSLSGIAANCAPVGETTKPANVLTGRTTPVEFTVNCVASTGAVEVRAATGGSNLDPNGYTVQLAAATPVPLSNNGRVVFESLAAGNHTVTLAGLAANCTTDLPNPRTLAVAVGGAVRDTARTVFTVTCAP